MREALALKYRPARFCDLVGQRPVTLMLQAMVAADKTPNTLLFHGSHGTGKTSAARVLAAALNCETPPGPCTHCVSCKAIAAGASVDLREIDAASHGLVDDIRTLRTELLYATGGRYHVVVLDEAQSISPAGFNALLKIAEEPPPGCVFILCTTEAHRIPETITSRFMPFAFRRIATAEITARLAHIAAQEGLHVEPDLLHLIAERADGALRDAIMSLDQLTRAGISTVSGYTDLIGEPDYGPRLLAALATGDPATANTALDEILTATGDAAAVTAALVGVVRDLLTLHAGGRVPRGQAATGVRRRLAERISTPAAYRILSVLWELKTKIRIDGDPRTNLHLAAATITGQFTRTAPAAPQSPAGALTLARMAQLARPDGV